MRLEIETAGVESAGVKKTMEFGIGDVAVVIDILRNRLYSKPVQTLVQEYISNARDAHREIGSNESLVITAPTILEPVFKVRDFGPGINPERYADVFVKYAASTKRTDDLQTGGFGIGAKSAWSYTDSFTVSTFIDGVRRDYVNHVGEVSQGKANLVNESATDEPNGTEIKVAVEPSDIDRFRQAIFRATYFWQSSCQFQGIEQEELPNRVGIEIEEGVEIVKTSDINPLAGVSYGNRAMIVSLDGIPYPVDDYNDNNLQSVMKMLNDEWTVVVHLDTGDIGVAANREQINYSDETQDTLGDVASFVVGAVRRYIDRRISAVDSVSGFFHTYRELSNEFKENELDRLMLEFGDYRIQNWTIASSLFSDFDIVEVEFKRNKRTWGVNTKRLEWQERQTIKLKHLGKCIYYVDSVESQAKLTRRMRTAVSEARENLQNVDSVTLLRPKDKVAHPAFSTVSPTLGTEMQVIKDLGAIAISTVEMAAVEKRPSMKERGEVVLHVFERGRSWGQVRSRRRVKLSENETTYIYVQLEDNEFPHEVVGEVEFSQWLRNQDGKMDFCGVAPRSVKLIADDPNFVPLQNFLDNFQFDKKLIDGVTWGKLGNHQQTVKLAQHLQGMRVTDDQFTLLACSLASEFENTNRLDSLPKILAEKVEQDSENRASTITTDCEAFQEILDQYPLVKRLASGYDKPSDVTLEELTIYVNAKKELTDAAE